MSLSFVSPYLIHEMALEGACRAKKGTRKYFSMDVPVASINDLQETKNNMLNIYIYIYRERERELLNSHGGSDGGPLQRFGAVARRPVVAAQRHGSQQAPTPRMPAPAGRALAPSWRMPPATRRTFVPSKERKQPRSLVHTNSGRATAAEPNKLLLISLQLLFTSDNDSINIMKLNP
jgi:hypothetical protein